MLKNLKMDRPRVEPRNVRERSTSRYGNQLALLRQPPKAVVNPQPKIVETDLVAPAPPEILHKEVFNNNMATVEVTVRATPPHMPGHSKIALSDKCEWRKADDEDYSFSKFDPLRTLHFLSKELQLKLKLLCPDDPNMQQIVHDMQNAMQRLPPDIITQLQDNIIKDSSGDMRILNLKDNTNQTVQTLLSSENFNQLQEKIKFLEEDLNSKDCIITELQKEKFELKNELENEKETREKIEVDNESLKNKCKKMEDMEKQQIASSTHDLKVLIEELRTKYITIQKENTEIRNEYNQGILVKDKLNMLLECKEKQLEELRNELRNIQGFICAQVRQYQSKTNLSPSSSISSKKSKHKYTY